MPLDKQAEAFIKQLEEMGGPALNEMPPATAREAAGGLGELGGEPESVAGVVNRTIAGPVGDIPIRIYTPEGSRPFPVVVYFHGGGWVIGNPDMVDATCRILANRARAVVVSVDYRLAPEQKFPAAVADCYAATQWVADNAGELHGDPQRIAVAGDSAGGNLAAVIALLARDRATPKLAFQVLFYPVTDHNLTTASYQENGKGYFLTYDMMKWFWDHYLNNDDDGRDWQASPLRAENKRGLPPAFVATAEFDPLRDEGEAYAELLRLAGNTVTAKRYDGQIHGFVTLGTMDQGKQAIEDAAAALRQAFGVKAQV
jgi:acetyl esterase